MPKKKTEIPEEQDTQKKILAAARRVFHKSGFAGARMQEIADEAGINKALLHYYFRSKDQLFEHVFREAISHTFPFLMQTMASELPLEEKIEKFVCGYIDMLAEHPYIPAFVLNAINTKPEKFFSLLPLDKFNLPELLAKQIRTAVRQKRIRNIPPRQFIANIISLCVFPFAARPMLQVALNIDSEAGFADFIEERKKTLVPFILNALRP